jgi:hypothetical protein
LTAQHDPTRCCATCAWALELDSLDATSHGQAVACGWTGPTPPLPEWLTHPEDTSDAIEAATAYGISEKTLSRARQALKIVTVRAGNRWLVSLPASTEPDR